MRDFWHKVQPSAMVNGGLVLVAVFVTMYQHQEPINNGEILLFFWYSLRTFAAIYLLSVIGGGIYSVFFYPNPGDSSTNAKTKRVLAWCGYFIIIALLIFTLRKM